MDSAQSIKRAGNTRGGTKMYNLLENKNKSSADFRAFLAHMINERSYLQGMDEQAKSDFMYHYDKLPQYFEEFIQRYEMDILKATVSIQLGIDRLQKVGK